MVFPRVYPIVDFDGAFDWIPIQYRRQIVVALLVAFAVFAVCEVVITIVASNKTSRVQRFLAVCFCAGGAAFLSIATQCQELQWLGVLFIATLPVVGFLAARRFYSSKNDATKSDAQKGEE